MMLLFVFVLAVAAGAQAWMPHDPPAPPPPPPPIPVLQFGIQREDHFPLYRQVTPRSPNFNWVEATPRSRDVNWDEATPRSRDVNFDEATPRSRDVNWEEATPRSRNFNKVEATPRSRDINWVEATPRYINLNDEATPRDITLNDEATPRIITINDAATPRSRDVNWDEATPRSRNFNKVEATPRSRDVNWVEATPRYINLNDEATPRDITLNDEATPRIITINDAATPRDHVAETPRDYVVDVTPRNDESPPRDEKKENPEALDRETTENGQPLWEGDMILTEEQILAHYSPLDTRKAIKDEKYRWTNGVVSYAISASSEPDRQAILSGLKHWTDNSCLRFVEVPEGTQKPHLIFKKLKGCYSNVGMIWWQNGQDISIGPGCTSVGTVAHEVGHAIGFYHEQSRTDRDQYVKLFTQNMEEGKEFNFQKQEDTNNYGVSYDLGSLMHYGLNYFSANGKNTMVPIDVMKTFNIGQRQGLSFLDLKLANIMYKCDAGCSSKPACRNGGFVDKNCRCRCPDGYTGSMCEQFVRVPGPSCGGTITGPTTITTPNYPGKYPKGSRCIWQFNAPSGKRINVVFESFDLIQKGNDNTCPWDSLEVRFSPYDGTTYCAKELNNMMFTSSSNLLILLFKADYDWNTGFKARVTFV